MQMHTEMHVNVNTVTHTYTHIYIDGLEVQVIINSAIILSLKPTIFNFPTILTTGIMKF